MQVLWSPLELRSALCFALVASALAALPALARADSVLLITPRHADPVSLDVFHRLEAELKIHGYETEAAPSDAESKAAARAQAAGAVAAFSIVKRGTVVALQVWLIDRSGSSAGPRRIEAGGAQDAASLLAVRAVDLLRATFGDPHAPASSAATSSSPAADGGRTANPVEAARALDASSRPAPVSANTPASAPARATATAPASANTPASASARATATAPASANTPASASARATAPPSPASAPAHANATAPAPAIASPPPATDQPTPPPADPTPPPSAASLTPDEPSSRDPQPPRVWLSAAGALIYPGARFGTAWGPALGLDVWALSWLALGVHGAAPLIGAELSTGSGSARLVQELAWLEVRARVLALGPVEVSPLIGGGIEWLQGQGRANQPLTSGSGHNWSWMAQLGLRIDVAIVRRFQAFATLRALAFAPAIEVAVARDSARLALPSLSASVGLALGLF